jgi:CheY-like chemotaxis protein
VSGASPVQDSEPGQAKARILVVEDEVLLRALVAQELRAQGYTVVEAANADEAMAILGSSVRVGLVLTDVEIPGTLDGIALARLVRAAHPMVKVVIVSGLAMDAQTRTFADGCFAKPYDFPRLLGHIKVLLAKEQ